jgi:transposase-like protein
MSRLREVIGSPLGLAISTDADQAIMSAVAEVFPQAKHRECMFHLVTNFKKRYRGKVFDDHLWAAAYSWNPYLFEKHWVEMEKVEPAATDYLRRYHKKVWTRSQFRIICKVDYVTNNLVESFNNWIKEYKFMNLDDLMDKIRQLIMIKWNQRRKIGKKLDGLILPHIIKKLNEQSRELNLNVSECS